MPTALDNGQRSPRRLLRKVVARLLGGMPGTSSTSRGDTSERVAVVAVAAVLIVALIALIYLLPRGGRRPR